MICGHYNLCRGETSKYQFISQFGFRELLVPPPHFETLRPKNIFETSSSQVFARENMQARILENQWQLHLCRLPQIFFHSIQQGTQRMATWKLDEQSMQVTQVYQARKQPGFMKIQASHACSSQCQICHQRSPREIHPGRHRFGTCTGVNFVATKLDLLLLQWHLDSSKKSTSIG